MSVQENLRWVLEEWFRWQLPAYVPRAILSPRIPPGMALAVVGVRRSGKTYALYELADHLRQQLPLHNVVYVNFEDDRLLPLQGSELRILPEVLAQHFDPDPQKPTWLLLDEVQHLPSWEATIRRFLDRNLAKIVLTGSTASLLPSSLSSTLAGRVVLRQVFPLSFREFLRFHGEEETDPERFLRTRRAEILKWQERYLRYGGFPAVVRSPGQEEEILSAYFDSLFYRDLVERYRIRKVPELEAFLRILFRNIGQKISLKKVENFLNTLGMKGISRTTLSQYLRYAQEAFLVYPVEIFSYGIKDRLQYPRKIYAVDSGLIHLHQFKLKVDWGAVLENAVFLELKRRGHEVYYWQGERGWEVDFVVVQSLKPVQLLQVAWSLTDEQTRQREIRSLLRAHRELGVDACWIITRDEFGEIQEDSVTLRIRPFWYWALAREVGEPSGAAGGARGADPLEDEVDEVKEAEDFQGNP